MGLMWVSKYKSSKTIINGITFDSKKEGRRYEELLLMQKAGIISHLKLQPTFELQPTFKKNGVTFRAIKYIADFQYMENGKTIIEDVKASASFKTDVYKIKRKMFEYFFPNLEIREIY